MTGDERGCAFAVSTLVMGSLSLFVFAVALFAAERKSTRWQGWRCHQSEQGIGIKA